MRTSLAMATVVALGAGLGCGDRHREPKEAPRDAQRARRVIEPSNERVGPLPPYAIRAEGVGPYKLGEKLSVLLEQLVSGPQIVLFEIPGVVHRSVIRAEADAILVGGEQASTASFIGVVGGDVARTESGIHVGSTRDELVAALGAPIDDVERARDPRLIVPSGLPSLRAVVEAGKVTAIVVTAPAPPGRSVGDCQRPAATERGIGACLTGAGELVEVAGEEVVIRTGDGERTLATSPRFPGLVFAAPLRTSDGRDELAVITRTDEPAARSWSIAAYRLEGTRLVGTVDATQLYQLSNANARWIGADLHDVELYLELTSRPEGIEVGGLLTTHSSSRTRAVRDVVVISPASVNRHRGKSAAAEPSSAPATGSIFASSAPARVTQDAGVDALDPARAESEPAEH
ncbi:MAG: hypothetical protein E6J91_15275 [Deltaproteobacteria bacterium]|nr:MAG: hypothetical protein E6J91_15275 [Deltaproteobacteria bacterium]